MLVLYTDFGARDLYAGQVKATLAARAPGVPVLDATHDLAGFAVEPAAHLLAALAGAYPRSSVFLAVVDPGVGTARAAIVLEAGGRRYVGPDNGLLSVLWARAKTRKCWRIAWRPKRLASSFHGRDLFAPVAAALAVGRVPRGWLVAKRSPEVLLDPADLAQVIYIDHYGNAVTGLRKGAVLGPWLRIGRRLVAHARIFEETPQDEPFWYYNSMDLVEIAARRASAARMLGLRVGTRVAIPAMTLRRSRSRGNR